MAGKSKCVIGNASPHTIKKFELIEEYIKSWAQKLMLNDACNSLIFIDCMCNSGVYKDNSGVLVEGTPVRVSKILLEVARTYTDKMVHIYLNDKEKVRVDELKKHIPQDERNFHIVTSVGDANELLNTIGPQLYQAGHMHYFLLYDPYDASIDWKALLPFFRNWGEVMINHMVSDPVRAITSAKKKTTKEKYENTYLEDFEKLVPYGSDKKAYEARVEEIIDSLKGSRRYYVSAFPFYNTSNGWEDNKTVGQSGTDPYGQTIAAGDPMVRICRGTGWAAGVGSVGTLVGHRRASITSSPNTCGVRLAIHLSDPRK